MISNDKPFGKFTLSGSNAFLIAAAFFFEILLRVTKKLVATVDEVLEHVKLVSEIIE